MMQSGLAGQDRSGRVVLVKGSAAKKGEEAVNSDKFRRKNAYDVPADQVSNESIVLDCILETIR
jgi:ribosome biogenesis protein MAK21